MSKAALVRQGTFDQPEPTVISAGGDNPYANTGPQSQGQPAKESKKTPEPSHAKKTGKPVVRNNPFPVDNKPKPKTTGFRKEDTNHSTGVQTKGKVNTTTSKTTDNMSAKKGEGGDTSQRDAIEDIGKNFIDRVEKTERDNVELNKENQTLKTTIEQLEKENKQLHVDNKRTHDEMVSIRDQAQAKSDKIGKLQEELKTAEKKDSTKKLQDLEHENKTLKDELKTTEEKDKKLLSDCNLLRSQMANLKKDNQELEQDFKVLKDKLRDSEKKLKDKDKSKSEEAERDKKNHYTEVSQLKGEVDSLHRKYKLMEDKFKIREKELQEKANHNEEKYVQVVQEMEREIGKLKEDHKRIKHERDTLLRQNEKMSKEQSEKMSKMVDKDFMNELQLANKRAIQQKEKVERDLAKVKREFEQYKKDIQKKDGEQAFSQVKINDLTERVKQMKINMSSMQELLKERESHIADLRIEVNDLRNNCHAFQKELNSLRDRNDDDVTYDKYNDLQSAHRKLLDENKHLRTVIARTNIEETNTASERAEIRVDYEKTKEKLVKAQARIKQMERWMDEIFNDESFDVVISNIPPFTESMSQRGATTSFPDIALSETPASSRGMVSVAQGSRAKVGARKKPTPRKDSYQPPGKHPRKDNYASPRKNGFGKQ